MLTQKESADRARLVGRDVIAILINNFVENPTIDELEVICPEPGTTLDTGVRFIHSDGVTPEWMYSRIYTIALRGHWLKREVWVKKRGRSVWLYKYDPKARTDGTTTL